MAPVHRMDMYHDVPPPPIPIKLKPKTLKKLSQQANKGTVYVILPNSPPPPPRGYLPPNFTLAVDPRIHRGHHQLAPHGSVSETGSIVSSNQQQRFRPEKPGVLRPRPQQPQWIQQQRRQIAGRSNWIQHLSNDGEDERDSSITSVTPSSGQHPAAPRLMASEVQLSSRVASMTIADVSPRFALKKILMLSDNKQYRESANFINRLSGNTFGVIVHDLPVDLFIESMPQSLPIIESLYAKVFLSDGILQTRNSIQFLRPESVVMQMVKYFAQQQQDGGSTVQNPTSPTSPSSNNVWRWDYCGPFMSSCKKLLRVIVLTEPKIRKGLQQKRRALDKAIEGLGQHGLVGTSDENLMNLHDALQVEFQRVVQSYKVALSKLEELDLASSHQNGNGKKSVSRTVSSGPAPIAASHQRLLSLKQNEIQERLIKNKTLLNVVEPTLTNHSLDLFLGILQRRIELDKDVLFQYTQLRRDQPSTTPVVSTGKPADSSIVVAPLLMKYSHGCQQVLELMREVSTDQSPEDAEGEDVSDVSGYHSDSDSAVMASGNSPFVSKSARYNFLTRSVRLGSRASIRTSLLVNSLGLEMASSTPVKGQSPSSAVTNIKQQDPRRLLIPADSSSSSRFSSETSSQETDSRSSGSLSGSPDESGRSSSCKRCQQQPVASSVSLEANLKAELEAIKAEMKKANMTINALQEREKQMKARLATQAQKMAIETSASTSLEQRASLIRSYGNLYAQSRVETLEWLDKMEELRGADELKSKLLFSVIVLAFRSLQATASQMKDHIRRILQIPPNLMPSTSSLTPPPPPSILSASARPIPPPPPLKRKDRHPGLEVELSITSYLRQSVDSFDLTKNTEDVCNQIWATLYDYPCLQSCDGLVKYIKDCVRLAWSLVNQSPPFMLEYEARNFQADRHIRFHTSDPKEETIKTYLWPALVEGHNGPCLHKAVVIT